jgi:hypothetical protein
MEHPVQLVFSNAEALRERLLSEIELVEDTETLTLYAEFIFKLKGEEDELGRIAFRQAPEDHWLNAVYPPPGLGNDDAEGPGEEEDE